MSETLVQYTIRSTGQALKKHGHEVVTLLKGQMFYVLLLLWMSFAMLYYIEKVTKTPKWQLLELEQKYKTYLGLWLISLGQNFELSQQLLALQMEVEALRLREPPPYVNRSYNAFVAVDEVKVKKDQWAKVEKFIKNPPVPVEEANEMIMTPRAIFAGSKSNVFQNPSKNPLYLKDASGKTIITIPGRQDDKAFAQVITANRTIGMDLAGQLLFLYDNKGKKMSWEGKVLANRPPQVINTVVAELKKGQDFVNTDAVTMTISDDIPGGGEVSLEVTTPKVSVRGSKGNYQFSLAAIATSQQDYTTFRNSVGKTMTIRGTISDGANAPVPFSVLVKLPGSY